MKELNGKLKRNKLTKQSKGITLIALVITVIVLLILAGVTIATLTGDNGLLQKAGESKNINEKGQIEEQIKLAYNDWKLRKETGETVDLQNTVQITLDKMYDNATVNKQGKAIIINVKGHEFTLIDDGTLEDGQLAYLDIADGSIQLYKDGYIQGTNAKVSYGSNGGKYVITGTTIQNTIEVLNEGEYDITIKNVNIDFSDASTLKCPFKANGGYKATGCFVNLTLEGNNKFQGKEQPGLSAGGGTPNVGNITNGSSLTIQGNGKLDTSGFTTGPYGQPGIGGQNWPSGCVSNITINSGNIIAKSIGGHGTGIGESLNGSSNNIVINGGNITAISSGYGAGIGACNVKAENIKINGGNIYVKSNYVGIGCGTGETGKIEINGGVITVDSIKRVVGAKCSEVLINGGTIHGAISCAEGGSISITGGNILARGNNNNINIATYSGSDLVAYTPKKENIDLYETKIKINGVGEGKKVTSIVTSDNISYGINDMYTLEDGMLYLYLPAGTRTITVEVEGKTYSGTVQTAETPEVVTLTRIN